MNKKKYLNELHNYLFEKEVSRKDIDSIITDYAELYDEAVALGFSHEEVVEKLGSAKEIYAAIKDTLHFDAASNRNKIVAVMPFIATMLFFAFGFGLDGWQYAWTFYLLIPVTAILINVRGKEKLIAVTPFISVIGFFILGMFFDLWHPGWLIYLIVPLSAIMLNVEGREKIVALSPFVLLITYILVSTYVSVEFLLYGWAIFALIPVIAILLHFKGFKDVLMLGAIFLGVAGHLTIYFMTKDVTYAWLPYLFPIFVGMLLGYVTVITDGKINIKEKRWLIASVILVVSVYLLVSFLVGDIWSWSWIILLIIPMLGVYEGAKFEHPVAYMPFISVIAFMLLGMLGNFWNFAWLVFLSIPVVAILTESNSDYVKTKDNETDDESSDS